MISGNEGLAKNSTDAKRRFSKRVLCMASDSKFES